MDRIPFWLREGWQPIRHNTYKGVYKTQLGDFPGEVEYFPNYGSTYVFIYEPPARLRSNACFKSIGQGWWRGHFHEQKKIDVGDAILRVKLIINASN